MNVKLEIIEAPAESGLNGRRFALTEGNTVLGRSEACQIALPDPARILSSQHGLISIGNGTVQYTDTSTNGSGLNSLDTPLAKGVPQTVQDGDVLCLGVYRIKVCIGAPAVPGPAQPAAAPTPDLGGRFLDSLNRPAAAAPAAEPAPTDELDRWLEQPASTAGAPGFGTAPVRPDREPASLSALTSAAVPVEDPLALLGGAATPSPLGQSVISDSPREDSKWWQEPVAANSLARQPTLDEAFEAPRFTPATPNSTRQSAAVAPSRLNEKLGIDKVAPELLENKVISALTTVVDKLIGILRARSSIKNDMRVDRTIIGVSENNPLKFSPTAQDALKLMFGPESPAFMNADRAFAEGILDLEEHQLATLQGIRFAYDQMLRQFSPEAIQALAEASGKGGSSVLGGNKKKLWEVYEQHYQQLTSDPEASYNRLFGEALAQAYEAGLKELKLRRR